jgi:hypothetical protein
MVKINRSLGNQRETKPCQYYYKGVESSETVREAGFYLKPEEPVHPYSLLKPGSKALLYASTPRQGESRAEEGANE